MALKAQNTISGKEYRLFLDGEEMAHIKTFEANVEKNKSEVNIIPPHDSTIRQQGQMEQGPRRSTKSHQNSCY